MCWTRSLRASLLLLPSLALLGPAAARGQLTFDVVGGDFFATGVVSPDGQVVGINENGGAGSVLRWENGSVQIVNSGSSRVSVGGLSTDGDVIVGSEDETFGSDEAAFLWESGVGLTFLAPLGSDEFMRASDVSHDGLTSVGTSQDLGGDDTAWTSDFTTVTPLADVAGGADSASARAISGDGTTVVGQGTTAAGLEAVRWVGGVPTALGDLAGGAVSSRADDVSDDGAIVVGRGTTAAGSEAFLWNGTMQGLGTLPTASTSTALGVSGDGEVVVGRSGSRAFVWSQQRGMVDLEDFLVARLVDLGYVTLTEATSVSSDGTVVVGRGFDDDSGLEVVWRVTGLDLTPSVPGLPLWAGIATAAGLLGGARRGGRLRR